MAEARAMVTKRFLRSGQAFMELAVGMLAVALVLTALLSFASYITTSLDVQRTVRADAGVSALGSGGLAGSYVSSRDGDTVELEPLAGEYIFGDTNVKISEEVHLPPMGSIP